MIPMPKDLDSELIPSNSTMSIDRYWNSEKGQKETTYLSIKLFSIYIYSINMDIG